MAKNITIQVRPDWKIESGVGKKCFHCSGLIFGKQARLILDINGKSHPQETYLCLFCAQEAGIYDSSLHLP